MNQEITIKVTPIQLIGLALMTVCLIGMNGLFNLGADASSTGVVGARYQLVHWEQTEYGLHRTLRDTQTATLYYQITDPLTGISSMTPLVDAMGNPLRGDQNGVAYPSLEIQRTESISKHDGDIFMDVAEGGPGTGFRICGMIGDMPVELYFVEGENFLTIKVSDDSGGPMLETFTRANWTQNPSWATPYDGFVYDLRGQVPGDPAPQGQTNGGNPIPQIGEGPAIRTNPNP